MLGIITDIIARSSLNSGNYEMEIKVGGFFSDLITGILQLTVNIFHQRLM